MFKQTIGQKSIIPFRHADSEKCDLNASIFPVFVYKYRIIDQKKEDALIDIFLTKYNITNLLNDYKLLLDLCLPNQIFSLLFHEIHLSVLV